MRLQHGLTGGFPTTRPSKLPSTLAHTPNLRASLGQVPPDGFGLGPGVGVGQVVQPLARAKKRRLSARKIASGVLVFEAISS